MTLRPGGSRSASPASRATSRSGPARPPSSAPPWRGGGRPRCGRQGPTLQGPGAGPRPARPRLPGRPGAATRHCSALARAANSARSASRRPARLAIRSGPPDRRTAGRRLGGRFPLAMASPEPARTRWPRSRPAAGRRPGRPRAARPRSRRPAGCRRSWSGRHGGRGAYESPLRGDRPGLQAA